MAFELKSNPLENNALFAGTPEPAAEPKKKSRAKKKPAAQTEKPKPVPAAPQKTAAVTDPDEYTRATFIVRRDLLKALKDYAYTERREIKDVINEILDQALTQIQADYAKKGIELLEKK